MEVKQPGQPPRSRPNIKVQQDRGVATGAARPRWHHVMMWNHNSIDLWWRPCFSFCLISNLVCTENPVILRQRPFFGLHLFWTKNPLLLRRRPFFFEDRKRMRHHEIPPRVPSSLATPLQQETLLDQNFCSAVSTWAKINKKHGKILYYYFRQSRDGQSLKCSVYPWLTYFFVCIVFRKQHQTRATSQRK